MNENTRPDGDDRYSRDQTDEVVVELDDDFDRSDLPNDIPYDAMSEIEDTLERLGASDTPLVYQDAGPSGGGATGTGRADANVELHFHIGDVTNVNINVESEDEADSILSRIFGE